LKNRYKSKRQAESHYNFNGTEYDFFPSW